MDLTAKPPSKPQEEDEKVIIFHGFSDDQISNVIDSYIEEGHPDCHFAASTPQSRIKRLRDVIKEVIKEGHEMAEQDDDDDDDDGDDGDESDSSGK